MYNETPVIISEFTISSQSLIVIHRKVDLNHCPKHDENRTLQSVQPCKRNAPEGKPILSLRLGVGGITCL
ncbi:hypothetical protein AMELA_G00009650 [Ameiurus melas]|uniref:Uncharacterized protein n=1 Tax=Ameiurus melas TaxID=219545 RepID=A0A7J6BGX3_AMEME|nr:hypothetical protein AMELA_G00009650 [Ameiurus melas]